MAALQGIATKILKESRLPRTTWVTEEDLLDEKKPPAPPEDAGYPGYFFW